MPENILNVQDLDLDYLTARGRVQALRRVNLVVPAGEVVGVVGESGCGKSTLIMAILRLLAENAEVKHGKIRFNGTDILSMGTEALRNMRGREITMIFQDPMTSLNPVLSIGTQMCDIQYRDGLTRQRKLERAVEMLQQVGIPDPQARLNNYPHHFSGGMRQRITIAMALMARPKLLIADEPTTALDATLEVQIVHLLKELQRSYQCSILFISHHLNVIAELCSHVVVMYAGEVVERGTVRDIFHRAAHPYTQALLKCDPAVIKEKTRFLPTIAGEIPDLIHLPSGCIFQRRCSEAFEPCIRRPPSERRAAAGHWAKCYLLDREVSA